MMPPKTTAAAKTSLSLYSPSNSSSSSNLEQPKYPQSPTPKRFTSISQKIKSNLRHLRLGGVGGSSNHHQHEEQQKKGGGGGGEQAEFRIVHTPDRPVRLVSPLEAPTEEECFDEIKGWHSAAAASAAANDTGRIEHKRALLEEAGPDKVTEQVPIPAPVPQPPPIKFDDHRFGLGLKGLGIGLGTSPVSGLNLEEEEEEEQQHQKKQYEENEGRSILAERASPPALGDQISEQQSDGIFEFDDTDHNNLNEKNHKGQGQETKFDKDRKGKNILQPVPVHVPIAVPVPVVVPIGIRGERQYYPRRDSFVSEDEDNHNAQEVREKETAAGKENIGPWESKSFPPSPSSTSPSPSPHPHTHRNGSGNKNGKFVAARLLNQHTIRHLSTFSAVGAVSSSSVHSFTNRGDGTSSEERFKLELEEEDDHENKTNTNTLDVRGGGGGIIPHKKSKDEAAAAAPAQMQNLWSHLRRIKNQGGGGSGSSGHSRRRSEGVNSNFSSNTGGSDEYEYSSHDGAEIYEAQVVDLELRRKMERLKRGNCPYCGGAVYFRDLYGHMQDLEGPGRVHMGHMHGGEGPSYVCGFCRADLRGVKINGVLVPGPGRGQPAASTPAPVPPRQEGHPRPERGYDAAKPYVTGNSEGNLKVVSPPGTVPPKPLYQRGFLEQGPSQKTSNGLLGGQAVSNSRGGGGHRRGQLEQQNPGRDRIPARDPIPTISKKPQPMPICEKKDEQEASASKFSHASSIGSSSSSASSAPRKAPPRLADRPLLLEAQQHVSPSMAEQLRHRPPPPPPVRTIYASDVRKAGPGGRLQTTSGQQPRPGARDATKQIGAPSPLRQEITQKQAGYSSGPLLPATVYRPVPPLPTEQPASKTASLPPKFGLPALPSPQPKGPALVPRSSVSPGYVVAAAPNLSLRSRPNQYRILNPEQLQPVPHKPNHPSPLLTQAFTTARPSPHAPGPPRPSLTSVSATTAARQRQETPPGVSQDRYQPPSDTNHPTNYTQQQQLPMRPAGPPTDPNVLSSARDQATRNPRDHLAVPEPPSASSSTYSPSNESPKTPTASTFTTNSSNTFWTNPTTTTARTNPFSNYVPSPSSSSNRQQKYQYNPSSTTQTANMNALHITTPEPKSQPGQGGRSGTETTVPKQGAGAGGAGGGPPPSSAIEITPSSAQIPMLRYDDAIMSWMAPEVKARFEKAIAEKGDDAQVYMDIFDDYDYSSSVSSSTAAAEDDREKNKKEKERMKEKEKMI